MIGLDMPTAPGNDGLTKEQRREAELACGKAAVEAKRRALAERAAAKAAIAEPEVPMISPEVAAAPVGATVIEPSPAKPDPDKRAAAAARAAVAHARADVERPTLREAHHAAARAKRDPK
jgi:hypothetical protein